MYTNYLVLLTPLWWVAVVAGRSAASSLLASGGVQGVRCGDIADVDGAADTVGLEFMEPPVS
jgi:hypothetical protein